MNKQEIEKQLKELIETKHKELNLGKDYTAQFSKIRDFEGNAVGQIGEDFFKHILSKRTKIIDDGIIHTEYDVKTESGIYFEIKTARKGTTNNTFQFNGINPKYNYNYLICIGICEDKALFKMFGKDEIQYVHKERKHFVIQGDFKKQLVMMNPNNENNLKLTCSLKELYSIEQLIDELDAVL